MPVELAANFPALEATYPLSTDPISDGDNHIRLLKTLLKYHFPSLTAPVLATAAEVNILDGATLSVDDLNLLAGASTNGVTNAIIKRLSGLTSNVQTQLNGKPANNGTGATGTWPISISGRAKPQRSDGTNININWSGQPNQPTWLLGSNDGVEFYVWNPENFGVTYADTAGVANNLSGLPNFGIILSGLAAQGVGAIGTYALMGIISAVGSNPNDLHSGVNLRYASAGGAFGSAPSGTWKVFGHMPAVAGDSSVTLMMRVA